ncbi:MAG: GDSL-type esterase/lipase family protein, partial [Candidatus Zixiibacteriota bacterium]
MKRRIPTNIGRTLLFSLLPLAVLLLAVEIGVRVASIDVRTKSRQFPINKDINFPEIYRLDHDLFWQFRPNQEISSQVFSAVTYRINSSGLRGEEPKPDAACRIVALGNSCTFGWAVREQYIWTTALESMLNETQGTAKYDVINAGVPGYSSHQGRILCSRLLSEMKPQYLCIMFGWNDHWTAGDGGVDMDIQMPSSLTLTVLNALTPLKSFQFIRKLASTSEFPAPEIT